MYGQTMLGSGECADPSIPAQPRAFDGISEAVSRVRASAAQAQAMLDRVSPQPREVSEQRVGNSLGRQPYAVALSDLHEELNRLGCTLDQLENFV